MISMYFIANTLGFDQAAHGIQNGAPLPLWFPSCVDEKAHPACPAAWTWEQSDNNETAFPVILILVQRVPFLFRIRQTAVER